MIIWIIILMFTTLHNDIIYIMFITLYNDNIYIYIYIYIYIHICYSYVCILFLIYINDLEDDISSKVLKFTDDTKVFR